MCIFEAEMKESTFVSQKILLDSVTGQLNDLSSSIDNDEVGAGANEATKICWNLLLAPFFVL